MADNIDYLIFTIITLMLFAILRAWTVRRFARRAFAYVQWSLIVLVLAGGWFAVDAAAAKTRERLAEMISGYAPTYAHELAKLGHADIPLDASPDDPRYLRILQTQMDWLRINPTVHDIYTFRRRPDGRFVLMADSETDYDGNGVIEGERELRTTIGEPYEEDEDAIGAAFAGDPVFSDEPVTDRWGTWVSAYYPMYDAAGNIEAVLGVDFDARQWVTQLRQSRSSGIEYVAMLAALVGIGTTMLEWLYAALARARGAEKAALSQNELCELARSSVRESEARLRTMVENLPGGAVHWDGTRLTVNKAVERITGFPREQLATLDDWFEKVYREEAPAIRRLYEADRAAGFATPRTLPVMRNDGTTRHVEFSAFRDGTGEVWMLHDVTDRQEMEAELLHRSQHDPLTNLANREMFRQRLRDCIKRAGDDPDYKFATLFMDLDRFKLTNDMLGHAAGDRLLKTFAGRLWRAVQDCADAGIGSDHLTARLGGDEFTVLLSNLKSFDDASIAAGRLLEALAGPVVIAGYEVFPSASIGIVPGDPRYVNAEEVLRDADTAMYRAKSNGRGRAEVFDEGMRREIVDRINLENDLRRALERGELEVHYQPLIDLESSNLTGFEALARWNHPTRGVVSPTHFIPIAEETGLILTIGEWVMFEAARQLVDWQTRFPGMYGTSMSVNLSRRQLNKADLIDRVRQVFADTGIEPHQLVLEITESTVMSDLENGLNVLANLRELGVKLSMDDFGTGYSSLSCLHRFPLNCLKIDRSFIMNLSTRRDYAAVIHAIVALSHNLGMRVTAEGVETADHVVQLQALECDVAQGYYFARPLSATEAEAFILKHIGVTHAA